jgi:hypothetical protein
MSYNDTSSVALYSLYIISAAAYMATGLFLCWVCVVRRKLAIMDLVTNKILRLINLMCLVMTIASVLRSFRTRMIPNTLDSSILQGFSYFFFFSGLLTHTVMLFIRTHEFLIPPVFRRPILISIGVLVILAFILSTFAGLYDYYNSEFLKLICIILTTIIAVIFGWVDVAYTYFFVKYVFVSRRKISNTQINSSLVRQNSLIAQSSLIMTCFIWVGILLEVVRDYSDVPYKEELLLGIYFIALTVVIQWVILKIKLYKFSDA